jgi:hypothetical protein
MMWRRRATLSLLFTLALWAQVLFLGSADARKKKRSAKEWAQAAKNIDQQERDERAAELAASKKEQEERAAASRGQGFDMSDPGKWIEAQGGIENAMAMQGGGGGGGGNAMTFVHLNNQTITSQAMAEELVVQWRDLLSTAGIDVGVYVIEPHLLLLDTNDKGKVIQIKDFIVREAPGGEEHVECEPGALRSSGYVCRLYPAWCTSDVSTRVLYRF